MRYSYLNDKLKNIIIENDKNATNLVEYYRKKVCNNNVDPLINPQKNSAFPENNKRVLDSGEEVENELPNKKIKLITTDDHDSGKNIREHSPVPVNANVNRFFNSKLINNAHETNPSDALKFTSGNER